MNSHPRRAKHVLLFSVDVLVVLLSMLLSHALFLAAGWHALSTHDMLSVTLPVSAAMLLSHLALGLYESKFRDSIRHVFRRALISAALVFMGWHIVTIILPLSYHNLSLITGLILAAVGHTIWRYWAIFSGQIYQTRRKILVLGAGERAAFITRRMRRDVDRRHFDLVGFMATSSLSPCEDISQNEMLIDRTIDALSDITNDIEFDTLVLANEHDDNVDMETLLELALKGINIIQLEDFVEGELGQLAVEKMSPSWLLNCKGITTNKRSFDFIHYLFDASLALLVLLLTWPFMIGAIFAIYLDDGRRDKNASYLYRQIRVGRNGRLFEILKFRSMGMNAEKDGATWAVKNDIRVTRVGKYLRKYRIDELPQLLNVLKGDMSFVGPRPERPEFVETLSENIPYFNFRHLVKPGLSGWAQIKYPYGASESDSKEKLKFDLYYIKHRSFLLNIFILIRTAEIVLFGKGR